MEGIDRHLATKTIQVYSQDWHAFWRDQSRGLEFDGRRLRFQSLGMNRRFLFCKGMSPNAAGCMMLVVAAAAASLLLARAAESGKEPAWRSLPLSAGGKVDP